MEAREHAIEHDGRVVARCLAIDVPKQGEDVGPLLDQTHALAADDAPRRQVEKHALVLGGHAQLAAIEEEMGHGRRLGRPGGIAAQPPALGDLTAKHCYLKSQAKALQENVEIAGVCFF